MNVLFLAAEAAPFTKVGGLGDVAGSLPPALRDTSPDLDVRLVIPMVGGARGRVRGSLDHVATVHVQHPAGAIRGDVLATTHRGVPVYLVASAILDETGPVYGWDTGWDGHRYTFFSLAALELARAIGFAPEVVHAHDWHTAPAIPAVTRARMHGDAFLARARTIVTVHNLPYVGHEAAPVMQAFGLSVGNRPEVPWWMRDYPLPIALSQADRITTVSPGYAREILGAEHGAGLDGLLRARRDVLRGILNGLDLELWDPARDAALAARFDLERLDRRGENKRALQRELGLPEADVPLLAVVSRLSHQKGIDLVPDALRMIEELPFQAVFLGTGDHDVEARLGHLETALGDRARARIGFDEPLSRRIYAGADLLLLPSRYEPCGLAQMIAMRYGCVPVARETGGLADTVRDLDLDPRPTGILFSEASPASLAFALRRALAAVSRADVRLELQRRGMSEDFSWPRAAAEYAALYRELAG